VLRIHFGVKKIALQAHWACFARAECVHTVVYSCLFYGVTPSSAWSRSSRISNTSNSRRAFAAGSDSVRALTRKAPTVELALVYVIGKKILSAHA
jgi:hypothetical protein